MHDGELKIISGTSNYPLADKIAKNLKSELTDVEICRFADREIYVQINESVRGADVFVIQSTANPGNENIMELLILLDTLKRASAERITAVIPYYGYGRQDRKAQPRTPITAKLVANLISTAGANRILLLDVHALQIQGFFDIPVDHLLRRRCCSTISGMTSVISWLSRPMREVWRGRDFLQGCSRPTWPSSINGARRKIRQTS